MPRLARVGGAGGRASALEFVASPFSVVDGLGPHALGITYWFDPPATSGPHQVAVRLTGRRLDVDDPRTPAPSEVHFALLAQALADANRQPAWDMDEKGAEIAF